LNNILFYARLADVANRPRAAWTRPSGLSYAPGGDATRARHSRAARHARIDRGYNFQETILKFAAENAEDADKDVNLAAEIARWCEERHVDWSRNADPKSARTRPSCWGWSRAAGTGIRVAGSLAYVCARLAQETGDPLWKAKARALVQSIQAAQDPLQGGFAYEFNRSTDDTINHQPYDAVEAARCVAAVGGLQ
jgi:hypothetical protein